LEDEGGKREEKKKPEEHKDRKREDESRTSRHEREIFVYDEAIFF